MLGILPLLMDLMSKSMTIIIMSDIEVGTIIIVVRNNNGRYLYAWHFLVCIVLYIHNFCKPKLSVTGMKSSVSDSFGSCTEKS